MDISILGKPMGILAVDTTNAEDWIDRVDLPVLAPASDDELEEMSRKYESEALEAGISIADSFYALLEKWRDEEVNEWINKARSAIPNGWVEDVIVTHHPYDEETLEVMFDFDDGTGGCVHVSEYGATVIYSPCEEMSIDYMLMME